MVFDATTEFFHKRKYGRDGLQSRCKKCKNIYAKALSLKIPDKVKYWNAKSRLKHREKRNKATKAWFDAHPGYATKRYQSDRKKYAAKAKEWRHRQSQETKEKMLSDSRLRCSKWRARKGSKEWMRKYFKKYRLEKPHKLRSLSRNYKAKKKNAEGTHSELDVISILEQQGRKCYWCANALTKFHMDHVIPISKNGSNDASNLVASCPRCNISKGNRLPDEWPQNPRSSLLIAEYCRRTNP